MKQKWITLLALLCCLFALAACSKKSAPTPTPSQADAAEPAAATTFAIETEFGALQYPAEFQSQLKTDTQRDGEKLTVGFSTDVAEQNYPLFTVTISPDEGDSVGTIKDADGTVRNVFVELPELNVEGLSEADQDTLYAMQEGVNDLIDALNH